MKAVAAAIVAVVALLYGATLPSAPSKMTEADIPQIQAEVGEVGSQLMVALDTIEEG
jgi:hypothetical protein